jgi:hypothetical protein
MSFWQTTIGGAIVMDIVLNRRRTRMPPSIGGGAQKTKPARKILTEHAEKF